MPRPRPASILMGNSKLSAKRNQKNPPPSSPRHPRFPCSRCHQTFPAVELDAHLAIDHKLCIACDYKTGFKTYNELQDHLEKDHLYCEPCNWYAPSAQGLEQHNTHKHNMCSICKEYFQGHNEMIGHANCHRPRRISCCLCRKDFVVLSAAFNHLESEKCEGRAIRDDIYRLVRDFWRNQAPRGMENVSESELICCHTCKRRYNRFSDLLQHLETRSCTEGYYQGDGSTWKLVEYVQENLKKTVESRTKEEIRCPNPEKGPLIHPRVLALRMDKD